MWTVIPNTCSDPTARYINSAGQGGFDLEMKTAGWIVLQLTFRNFIHLSRPTGYIFTFSALALTNCVYTFRVQFNFE
jgi:hypothetical protein